MKRNRIQKACIPVFIAILSGMLLIGAVSATEFGPWSIQTVDSTGKVGQYSSVALDAAGNPAISYYDQTYGDLKYAVWDGSAWNISTVDCSKAESKNRWFFWDRGHDRTKDDEYIKCYHGTDKVGKYSSLAFDSSGKPRISYFDETKGDLKYAAWDGSSWVVTTVDSCKQVGEYSSLALDSSGNPKISYFDKSKGDLKYASWDGSRWVIRTVDNSKNVGEYSSLALDSSGNPRISYYDQKNADLKYASWDGSRWVITTVDGSKDKVGKGKYNWDGDHGRIDDRSKKVGKYSSIVLDSSGKPRISYYDQTNKDLKYASWNGTLWIITTVDNLKNVGEYSSLKLDANGDPRISYYDETHKDLKFAAWNSSNSRWVTETVDSSGKVGSFTSLALDLLGNPRISYYDQTHQDLKYTAGTGHSHPPVPKVTGISPSSGNTLGGTLVTINGTGFIGTTAVNFGTTAASSFIVVNATTITTISPPGAVGTVNVTVTTPGGTSATSLADQFTYAILFPTVTGISPVVGPASGGTVVNITGTGFMGATVVRFGTRYSTIMSVIDDSHLTAISPDSTAGTVDITVTTSVGTSATSDADQFTYIAAPTVTGISPAVGPLVGGTVVTITGTGFTGATNVTFGTAAGTSLTVTDDTNMSITSPAGTAATLHITVTTPWGTSATSPADQFTYVAAPMVTSILPISGPASGGTVVTIKGTGFTGATNVTFGTAAGTSLAVTDDTNMSITSPPGTAGTVHVTVKAPGGISAASNADNFTYIAAPVITGISPAGGPVAGGTVVAIKGTGFTGATAVSFGATAGTSFTVVNATSITVTSPPGAAGTVDVTVTTAGGTSATSTADKFTYYPVPTVGSISPASGPATGGTVVTITGSGFNGTSVVTFGGTAATSFTPTDDEHITATSPVGTGTVYVTVTTPGGTSTISDAGKFSYGAAPTVSDISPASGPAGGGTVVTLTGTGFTDATAVKFGNTAGTILTVADANIIVTSPLHSAGTVHVTVTTPGGTSTPSNADNFTYTAAPTVSGINPPSGEAETTIQSVTITGTNFVVGTTPSVWLVKSGETTMKATSVSVVSSTQISCTIQLSPYSPTVPGQWDVVVTNPDGQSGTLAGGFEVINPAPTVTSITPNSGNNDSVSRPVTIKGTNFGFGPNPELWLSKTGEAPITASNIVIIDTTWINFNLNIPYSNHAGLYDVHIRSADGKTAADALGAFMVTYNAAPPLVWDWSSDLPGHGWDGWSYDASCSGTTCSEYVPAIESGHGVYGATITGGSGGTTVSTVTKTFTAPSGKWNTLSFNGTLSFSSDSYGRWMDIYVNNFRVYHNTADNTPPGNGQPFTITQGFDPSATANVQISSGQDPAYDTQYTMQFDSLTLS